MSTLIYHRRRSPSQPPATSWFCPNLIYLICSALSRDFAPQSGAYFICTGAMNGCTAVALCYPNDRSAYIKIRRTGVLKYAASTRVACLQTLITWRSEPEPSSQAAPSLRTATAFPCFEASKDPTRGCEWVLLRSIVPIAGSIDWARKVPRLLRCSSFITQPQHEV